MSSTTTHVYLQIERGPRAGSHVILDPDRPIRIGRGLDCHVILQDPLASRVHAVISYRADAWWIRDLGSRNGTYVERQRVEEARLEDGSRIQIGSTVFVFRVATELPSDGRAAGDTGYHIKRQTHVSPTELDGAAHAVHRHQRRPDDFLALYHLGLALLEDRQPDELIRCVLEMLLERTGASAAGFLWLADDGQLKPHCVLPRSSAVPAAQALSRHLTDLVVHKQQAVWVADAMGVPPSDSLAGCADAICVPLQHAGRLHGVLHLYQVKQPFHTDDYELVLAASQLLAKALDRARRRQILQVDHQRLVDKHAAFDHLIGQGPAMRALKEKILRVARATGCVLIRGESGSGKELVARAIHQAGPRRDRPMLTVNCAAIPRDLMESQLFGHRRGAFTGADRDHRGWFEQADTGTLFLDEIGELTLEGQAKLLRILDGYPFTPVGGTREITVDVRVLAATNRDLSEFVKQKRFREDLFYRLTVFELLVPPLRQRGEDIDRLIDFFLEHFRMQHGRPGLALSSAARRRLRTYSWPGNVRQLRNVIDSAVVLAEGPEIQPEELGLHDPVQEPTESLRLDEAERRLIQVAMERTGGRVQAAARLLGISRATLYRKLAEYGLKESE